MVAGANMNVAVVGTVSTTTATAPGNFYNFSRSDVPGVVAANNFVSLFNPVGSGKTILIQFLAVDAYSAGATNVTTSMLGFRTTAASGGTLIAATAVSRFNPTGPDPVAQVRIGNPTVTLNPTLTEQTIHFPPPINAGSASAIIEETAIPSGATFQIPPGNGVVLSTSAGNVNQQWGFRLVWSEV